MWLSGEVVKPKRRCESSCCWAERLRLNCWRSRASSRSQGRGRGRGRAEALRISRPAHGAIIPTSAGKIRPTLRLPEWPHWPRWAPEAHILQSGTSDSEEQSCSGLIRRSTQTFDLVPIPRPPIAARNKQTSLHLPPNLSRYPSCPTRKARSLSPSPSSLSLVRRCRPCRSKISPLPSVLRGKKWSDLGGDRG